MINKKTGRAKSRGRLPKLRCSKWCGRGCTEAEYQAAVDAGSRLVKLLGPGWRLRVWENLGWWYEVRPVGIRGFSISGHLLQYTSSQTGRTRREQKADYFTVVWNWAGHSITASGKSPAGVIKDALQQATRQADAVTAATRAMERRVRALRA